MIVLDTHVWVWWVHGDANLPEDYARVIVAHESAGLGISAISCWEVAKLVEHGRLTLPCSVDEWIDDALAYPGTRFLDLASNPCGVHPVARAVSQRPGRSNYRCDGARSRLRVGNARPQNPWVRTRQALAMTPPK